MGKKLIQHFFLIALVVCLPFPPEAFSDHLRASFILSSQMSIDVTPLKISNNSDEIFYLGPIPTEKKLINTHGPSFAKSYNRRPNQYFENKKAFNNHDIEDIFVQISSNLIVSQQNDTSTKADSDERKSFPEFLNSIKEKMAELDRIKTVDIDNSLLLLNEMDYVLYNKAMEIKTMSKENSEYASVAKYRKDLQLLEEELKRSAESIIEDIVSNSEKKISVVKPFMKEYSENNLDKLKSHFKDISTSASQILFIDDKISESEVLGGQSKWRILNQIEATSKIQLLKKTYFVLIRTIYKAIGHLNGFKYQVDNANKAYSSMLQVKNDMDAIIAKSSEQTSCGDLITVRDKANKIIQKEFISQLVNLRVIGNIIELYLDFSLNNLKRKHSGADARLRILRNKRNLGHIILDLNEIILSKEILLNDIKIHQEAIISLSDAMSCE